MVKVNDSMCVEHSQVETILKHIEKIKSNATIQKGKKEGKRK